MKAQLSILLAGLLVIGAVPAYAHHSFLPSSMTPNPSDSSAEITSVQWTNPHSYFYVDGSGVLVTDGRAPISGNITFFTPIDFLRLGS